MYIIPAIIGAKIGTEVVNSIGIKPRYKNAKRNYYIFLFIVILISISCTFGFVYSVSDIINGNPDIVSYEALFICPIGIVAFIYLLSITPGAQKDTDYKIFVDQNNLLVVVYKGKLVTFNYIVTKDNKIAFANNANKHSCVSYSDNSPMSSRIRHKIVNYIGYWLGIRDVLSETVTVSLE